MMMMIVLLVGIFEIEIIAVDIIKWSTDTHQKRKKKKGPLGVFGRGLLNDHRSMLLDGVDNVREVVYFLSRTKLQ